MGPICTILYRGGEAELTEKRSRFLARTVPVSSEEEAAGILASVRKQYWDARHHCFAYTLGKRRELCRFSDDGEPGGTAGKPILDVLLGAGVTDALLVVTRYFGGTLLGTGGLVRAYGGCAALALRNSVLLDVFAGERREVICSYPQMGRIKKAAEDRGYYLEDVQFSDRVRLIFVLRDEEVPGFARLITELSGGSARQNRLESLTFGMEEGKLRPVTI